MPPSLRIAAAQFPVSGDIARNARNIEALMRQAADEGAQVVLFPETALPGYAPTHCPSLERYPWNRLHDHTEAIRELATALKLWVVLGSMRRAGREAPKICLHVISDRGAFAGTYDKRHLHGKEKDIFSPGDGPLLVDINRVTCGFLICYDNCYPELYAAYREMGVALLFHALHNAANRRATSIKDLMLASLIVRAADNGLWIAASNSSKRYSPLSACIVRPDGSMVRSKRHITGLAIDDYPNAALGWTYDNREN